MADALVLHALAAETASGTGAAGDLGTTLRTVRVDLDVDAVAGTTPGLLVTVESSTDGVSGWRSIGTIGPASATGAVPAATFPSDRYVRGMWTLSGASPSFTFLLTALPVAQYASLDDIKALGLPATAFVPPIGMTQAVFDAAINDQLVAVSGKVESYLRTRYAVPLTGTLGPNTYLKEIVKAVTDIEAFELLMWRGFNPDQFDATFETRWKAAWDWLKDIAKGVVSVPLPEPDPDDPVANPARRGARVLSRCSREW
jgi:phage gp36-like protein